MISESIATFLTLGLVIVSFGSPTRLTFLLVVDDVQRS